MVVAAALRFGPGREDAVAAGVMLVGRDLTIALVATIAGRANGVSIVLGGFREPKLEMDLFYLVGGSQNITTTPQNVNPPTMLAADRRAVDR